MFAILIGVIVGASGATAFHESTKDELFIKQGVVYKVVPVLKKEQVKKKIKLLDENEVSH